MRADFLALIFLAGLMPGLALGSMLGHSHQRWLDAALIEQLQAEAAAPKLDISAAQEQQLERCARQRLVDDMSGQEVGMSGAVMLEPGLIRFRSFVLGTTRSAVLGARLSPDASLQACEVISR